MGPRAAVFYLLHFIEDRGREGSLREQFDVAPENAVGGDRDRARGKIRTPPLRSVMHLHRKTGRMCAQFVTPVADHGRRAHHEERRLDRSLIAQSHKEGHGLMSLAKAHLVAEQSAQPMFPEEAEPFEAELLVRTKARRESFRRPQRRGGPALDQPLDPGLRFAPGRLEANMGASGGGHSQQFKR